MKRGLREPFFITRAINFVLGVIILALMLVVLIKKSGTEIFEIIIFALAAVENFIGATISFSEKKKVRGNVYAIVCAVFLIVALILAMRYFVFV
jgi:heme/copper-type cytochrome/quinol oxidase subunit 4